jgi:hypothetical protein
MKLDSSKFFDLDFRKDDFKVDTKEFIILCSNHYFPLYFDSNFQYAIKKQEQDIGYVERDLYVYVTVRSQNDSSAVSPNIKTAVSNILNKKFNVADYTSAAGNLIMKNDLIKNQ